MDLKQKIGARIQEIRKNKGMKQEVLSVKMGINSKYLSSIERGKENPTLNMIISLAEALDVEISNLFEFVEIQDPAKRKNEIFDLLKHADDEELKLIGKVLLAILR